MRRLFTVIGVLSGLATSLSCSSGPELTPEMKDAALQRMRFAAPVTMDLELSFGEVKLASGDGALVLVKKLLVPLGLLEPKGRFRNVWSQEVNVFRPTQLLIEGTTTRTDLVSPVMMVPLAERRFGEVTYRNTWKAEDRQRFAFNFTYWFKPILDGVPELGPFEGKAVYWLDPSEGRWKVEEASLGDGGLSEVVAWLNSNEPTFPELPPSERARRTMADLRTIATAAESFSVDWGSYPVAKSLEEIEKVLAPTYVNRLPRVDGWGHEFLITSHEGGYEVRALAGDGRQDEGEPSGPVSDFSKDIVFKDGRFVQWPRGM